MREQPAPHLKVAALPGRLKPTLVWPQLTPYDSSHFGPFNSVPVIQLGRPDSACLCRCDVLSAIMVLPICAACAHSYCRVARCRPGHCTRRSLRGRGQANSFERRFILPFAI